MILSPITQNPSVRLLQTIDAAQICNNWRKSYDIDVSKELENCSQVSLFECSETKLQFFEPSSIAGSGELYERLHTFDWYYAPNRWEHQEALRNLRGCKTALEVGSGVGHFIESLIAQGVDAQGLELNEAAVAIAQAKNLPVSLVDLYEFVENHPESVDAVCSFQVLEHIPDTKTFIQACVDALKPGGILIFSVPDAQGFRKYLNHMLDMPPHHMTRWSKYTFKSLENFFPLRLKRAISEPLANYHIKEYIGVASYVLPVKFPLSRYFLKPNLFPLYEAVLASGIRKLLPGDCLYAEFEKL
jgi:2-polyprenyl-3-methyl-5-hydroxy-6-metoxy-1,4-benzoquinol methylase